MEYKIVTIDESNMGLHPQFICFINPKHPLYSMKVEWMKQRFQEGMRIKLLYEESVKTPLGFIEYVPGEKVWRGVSAAGYMFIHCIWTYSNEWKNRGIASILLEDCYQDALASGMNGVAVLSGTDSFLAKPELFLKNGYILVDGSVKGYQILAKQIKSGRTPTINNWQEELKKYQGFHIIYSRQCPWVAKSISGMTDILKEMGIEHTVTELTTPEQAQHAPSPYATFNLIYNGKLLAAHYISETRFKNILKKQNIVVNC